MKPKMYGSEKNLVNDVLLVRYLLAISGRVPKKNWLPEIDTTVHSTEKMRLSYPCGLSPLINL